MQHKYERLGSSSYNSTEHRHKVGTYKRTETAQSNEASAHFLCDSEVQASDPYFSLKRLKILERSMVACVWECARECALTGLKDTKSRDNEVGHLLTQPSSADLVRRDRAKFPLCFDLLQDPLVQRGRRLSLWLQLPS